jgi:hypothetical protein
MMYVNLVTTGVSSTASVGTVNAVIGNPVTGVSATAFVGNETVYMPSTVNGNSITGYLGVVGVQIT